MDRYCDLRRKMMMSLIHTPTIVQHEEDWDVQTQKNDHSPSRDMKESIIAIADQTPEKSHNNSDDSGRPFQ